MMIEMFEDFDKYCIDSCVEGSFDGNSLKVAELLVKNGFKEAYAIRGGLRGNKGWQVISLSSNGFKLGTVLLPCN